jgi:hypothetical protein
VPFLLLAVIVALAVFSVVRGRLAATRMAQASEVLHADLFGSDIRRMGGATCIGHDARALGPMRGMGALALTGTQLRFVHGKTGRAVSLPLDQIVEASAARSFSAGSSPLHVPRRRPVLVVHWVTGSGALHRIAWDVPEAVTWSSTLAQLIGR